jgi:uncharacterized protein
MIERRFGSGISIRTDGQGDEMALAVTGYAATFGTLSEPLSGFREILKRGCFKRGLDADMRSDIKFLVQHDPSMLLGRQANGSLTVNEDSKGLKFRCVLPRTQLALDTFENISSGLLSECSFAFSVENPEDEMWDEVDDPDNRGKKIPRRTILHARCFDVSCVSSPAYSGTSLTTQGKRTDTQPLSKNWSEPTPRNLSLLFPHGVPQSFPQELRAQIMGRDSSVVRHSSARSKMLGFLLN